MNKNIVAREVGGWHAEMPQYPISHPPIDHGVKASVQISVMEATEVPFHLAQMHGFGTQVEQPKASALLKLTADAHESNKNLLLVVGVGAIAAAPSILGAKHQSAAGAPPRAANGAWRPYLNKGLRVLPYLIPKAMIVRGVLWAGAAVVTAAAGVRLRPGNSAAPSGVDTHALLGRPVDPRGGKEEFPMPEDTEPQLLGGAPLPSILAERWRGGFAPIRGADEWDIHVGGEKAPDVKSSEGYAPMAGDARGANILWSEEVEVDLASGVESEARKSLTTVQNFPQPSVNIVDRIDFYQGANDDGTDNGVWYFEYTHIEDGYGAEAKVKGRVDENGVMDMTVRSVGHKSQRVSADDLMMNVIQGLRLRGVPIYKVQAQFDYSGWYTANTALFKRALQHQVNMSEKAFRGTDQGDVRPSAWERPRSPDLKTLFEMTTPQQHIEAAKRTHAGRFLQRYRFFPSDVRLTDVGVMVQFKGY